MDYEPVFKLPQSNIFMTDLLLPAYAELDPIITIINEKFELFLSKDTLKNVAEIGFNTALQDGAHKEFERKYSIFQERLERMKQIDIENSNNEDFVNLLNSFKELFKDFFRTYRETEFFYFAKIEKELGDYIKDKFSFEDVLSNKVEIVSWPEGVRQLADYIINMQHIKLEYRKLLNGIVLGESSVFVRILTESIKRTGREDVTSMTIDEVKGILAGWEAKDFSERHVYSYITWDTEKKEFSILSGGNAYRKIRELEKEIPKNEVIGTPASKGLIRGRVRIIPLSLEPEKHLAKMQKGEILVSETTGPEMTVAIEKAIAIVTDEGGLMSHAAIVAREFGVPCVVGTKYATEVFKDGDLVEVNANNGVVRKI